jgi:type I restriction enzyme S subunit
MLDLQDLKYAPTDFALSSADAIDEGDMLVIRTNGSKSLIGRAAVALSKLANAIAFASYLIRFRLARTEKLPAWVSLVWQTNRLRSWIESRAATSAGQHNISQSGCDFCPALR